MFMYGRKIEILKFTFEYNSYVRAHQQMGRLFYGLNHVASIKITLARFSQGAFSLYVLVGILYALMNTYLRWTYISRLKAFNPMNDSNEWKYCMQSMKKICVTGRCVTVCLRVCVFVCVNFLHWKGSIEAYTQWMHGTLYCTHETEHTTISIVSFISCVEPLSTIMLNPIFAVVDILLFFQLAKHKIFSQIGQPFSIQSVFFSSHSSNFVWIVMTQIHLNGNRFEKICILRTCYSS